MNVPSIQVRTYMRPNIIVCIINGDISMVTSIKALTHLPESLSSAFFMSSNVCDGTIRCDEGTGYNELESDCRNHLDVRTTVQNTYIFISQK